MVGILLLTHGRLGAQFIETARLIGIKSDEYIEALGLDPSISADLLRSEVEKAIRSTNGGNGVLILTDLFGGTPTNISLSYLEEGKVEVVTGLNLPMVIKAINSRDNYDLTGLAKVAADAGKENIYLAGEFLRQRLAKRNHTDK
jgi:PTS system mannose-specific IIA component